MHGFNTHTGKYKGLVIVVMQYRPLMWRYCFWNTLKESEEFILQTKEQFPGEWDGHYCFNKEQPLKEQATYAAGSAFSRVLCNIIDHDLVDRKW